MGDVVVAPQPGGSSNSPLRLSSSSLCASRSKSEGSRGSKRFSSGKESESASRDKEKRKGLSLVCSSFVVADTEEKWKDFFPVLPLSLRFSLEHFASLSSLSLSRQSPAKQMLVRSAAPHPSGPLRNNDSPSARTRAHTRALHSPKVPAMNEPKRAKLGSRSTFDATTTRNHSASTLAAAAAAAASLTDGGGGANAAAGASVVPPSSRPPPACLSHEIVDTFNVPGE